MKKIKSSIQVQEANEFVCLLQNNLGKILHQPFWSKKISMSEKIQFLQQIAQARRQLSQRVEEQIPEISGKNYTVSSINIEFEEESK